MKRGGGSRPMPGGLKWNDPAPPLFPGVVWSTTLFLACQETALYVLTSPPAVYAPRIFLALLHVGRGFDHRNTQTLAYAPVLPSWPCTLARLSICLWYLCGQARLLLSIHSDVRSSHPTPTHTSQNASPWPRPAPALGPAPRLDPLRARPWPRPRQPLARSAQALGPWPAPRQPLAPPSVDPAVLPWCRRDMPRQPHKSKPMLLVPPSLKLRLPSACLPYRPVLPPRPVIVPALPSPRGPPKTLTREICSRLQTWCITLRPYEVCTRCRMKPNALSR